MLFLLLCSLVVLAWASICLRISLFYVLTCITFLSNICPLLAMHSLLVTFRRKKYVIGNYQKYYLLYIKLIIKTHQITTYILYSESFVQMTALKTRPRWFQVASVLLNDRGVTNVIRYKLHTRENSNYTPSTVGQD